MTTEEMNHDTTLRARRRRRRFETSFCLVSAAFWTMVIYWFGGALHSTWDQGMSTNLLVVSITLATAALLVILSVLQFLLLVSEVYRVDFDGTCTSVCFYHRGRVRLKALSGATVLKGIRLFRSDSETGFAASTVVLGLPTLIMTISADVRNGDSLVRQIIAANKP